MRNELILLACLLKAATAPGAAAQAKSSPAFPGSSASDETWTQRKNAQGETVYIRCTATQCDMPRTAPPPPASPPVLPVRPEVQAQPQQPPVSAARQQAKNVPGKAVDEALSGQSDNSLAVPENAASEPPSVTDWSGVNALQETLEESGAAFRKGSAIEQARRMLDAAIEKHGLAEESSAVLAPSYRNSPTFRRGGAQNLTTSE